MAADFFQVERRRLAWHVASGASLLTTFAFSVLFGYSGVSKITHADDFVRALSIHGVLPPEARPPIAILFGPMETLLGLILAISLLHRRLRRVAMAAVVCALATLLTYLLIVLWHRGGDVPCGCIAKATASTEVAIVQDGAMLALAVGAFAVELGRVRRTRPGAHPPRGQSEP